MSSYCIGNPLKREKEPMIMIIFWSWDTNNKYLLNFNHLQSRPDHQSSDCFGFLLTKILKRYYDFMFFWSWNENELWSLTPFICGQVNKPHPLITLAVSSDLLPFPLQLRLRGLQKTVHCLDDKSLVWSMQPWLWSFISSSFIKYFKRWHLKILTQKLYSTIKKCPIFNARLNAQDFFFNTPLD